MRINILFSCLILSNFGLAQGTWQQKKDSMVQVISKEKEDTNKIKSLLVIGKLLDANEVDTALIYYNQAEKISRKLNYVKGIVDALSGKGTVFINQNKIDDAVAVGEEVVKIAEQTKINKLMCNAYINAARPYASTGNYKKCIEYSLKGLELAEQMNDSSRITTTYCNLGYYYNNMKESKMAYKNDLKAVEWAGLVHNKNILEVALLNLGNPLMDFPKYDSAILVLKQAKEIADEVNDKIYGPIILSNLIIVYRQMGNNEKTKPLVEELIIKAKQSGATEGLILAFDNKGDYFINRKEFDSAKYYYQLAIDSSKQNKINKYLEVNYKAMMDVFAGQGKFSEYEIYRDLRDSVKNAFHSDEMVKNTQELEAKYESQKKENQIKIQTSEIKQNRLWNTILIGGLLFVVGGGLLGYRNFKNKQNLLVAKQNLQQQTIQNLQSEKQLLATQSVLKGQEEERTRLAKDLHDGLGGILSSAKFSLSNMKQNLIITPENANAFEKTMLMLDQSITELRRVAHNMMPETLMKLSIDEALQDYCHQVSDSGALKVSYQSFGIENIKLDDSIRITIYRVVQELINNSIKHAHASQATVQFINNGKNLNITVEDNGIGFDKTNLDNATGIGYKNLQSRIVFLKGSIDIQSQSNKGTSVYIEIPLTP